MESRTKSCCKREYVGVVYHCGDSGYWQRCKHYEEDTHFRCCKWYSYAKYSSCTCKEAQEEADEINNDPRKEVLGLLRGARMFTEHDGLVEGVIEKVITILEGGVNAND